MFKLNVINKEFTDSNGKQIPYNDVVSSVVVSGIVHDIKLQFDSKIVKDNVVSNIGISYLTLLDKSYETKSGVKVERFVPMVYIIFNEVNKVEVPVKLTSGDIFAMKLVRLLKNKK